AAAAAPAVRPAPSDVAALPPVAAPSRPAVTQVAAASRPAALEPPRPLAPSGIGGGSAPGAGARPLLPPPVPFGSAGAATLGSGLGR
ncbi:hypothetical protein QWZ14_07255, partial [Paeniroseomonas aquatica]|nr:hypothetical protein [Paeniroseomonas aquatica]